VHNKGQLGNPSKYVLMFIASIFLLGIMILILLYLMHGTNHQLERTPFSLRGQIAVNAILNCFGSTHIDIEQFTEETLHQCYTAEPSERILYGASITLTWNEGLTRHATNIASNNYFGAEHGTYSYPVTVINNGSSHSGLITIMLEDRS